MTGTDARDLLTYNGLEDFLCEGSCKNLGMCDGTKTTWCGRKAESILRAVENARPSPASEGVREAKLAYETARHIIGHLAANCGLSFIDVTQDDWDAIKRLIAAPSEAGSWLPIESAPRSWDAPILARNSRLPMCPPVVVRWSEEGISDELPDPHWCDAATHDGRALYFNSNYFDYWMEVPSVSNPGSGA